MYAHSRAPVRIGIAGGGTDLPVWTKSGRIGECLSMAIAAYTHAVAITRSDGQVVASYRQRDSASAATEIANGLIRESALLHGWEDGFEVHTLSEMSSRGSGLGVSSSIAVALSSCFQSLAGLKQRAAEGKKPGDFVHTMLEGAPLRATAGKDHVVFEEDPDFRTKIARDAWTVEIDKLRRPIGRQDHMAAAHGGLRLYRFEGGDARIERTFSIQDTAWLAKHLLLVKLPEGHDSRAILSKVTDMSMLESAASSVPLAVKAIENLDARMLGEALICGQKSKLGVPGATPSWVQEIIDEILIHHQTGVTGCKITGAGGGGHIVVAVENTDRVREVLKVALKLPVMNVVPDMIGIRSEAWA